MKEAILLHNPSAGDEQHDKDNLISLVKSAGYQCRYSSTKKKGWKKIDAGIDLLVVAGGDGTVRKIITQLLNKKRSVDFPIAVLPCGTANNIANSLGISGDANEIVQAWRNMQLKKYDIGQAEGLKNAEFFLEAIGFGVFPQLMKKMKKVEEKEGDTPEVKLDIALQVLHDIIQSIKAEHCIIEADGQDLSGKYILVEIMNTPSIGPNLNLAPNADPGDGEFELVLVSEEQQKALAAYVENKMKEIESPFTFQTYKVKNVCINWCGDDVHMDDQLVDLKKKGAIDISIRERAIVFLVT